LRAESGACEGPYGSEDAGKERLIRFTCSDKSTCFVHIHEKVLESDQKVEDAE